MSVDGGPDAGSVDGVTAPVALTDHVAGQAAMVTVLREQQSAPERGRWARLTGRSPLAADARPAYLDAVGQIRVAQLLGRLGPEWTVLHTVPVGAESTIDHVLVGPAGVVTLTTTNHGIQRVWVAGTSFLVSGEETPYIRDADQQAKRASKLLTAAAGRPVTASAMIAVVDPKQLVVREKPASVVVVTSSGLLRALRAHAKRGPALAAANLEALRTAATDPTTWHQTPAPGIDSADVRARFDRLHRAATRARRNRATWRFAALLAALTLASALYLAITSGLLEAIV